MLCLAAAASGSVLAADPAAVPKLSIGLITDLHYGDKPEAKTRFYRETLGKLREAVGRFNAERPAFIVELGDLIDQADSVEQEIGWLQAIEQVFATAEAPRHYVLGNHCVGTLTKAEFQAHTGGPRRSYYSFDEGGVHFIILDACFRSDGEPYQRKNFEWTDANVPAGELSWLREDLASTKLPVIVLAHQRLDEAAKHSVRNAAAVRAELEQGGKVLAVFQGHSHQNGYQQIAGVHYCTLVAMVEGSGLENSGYAMLDIMPDDSLRLRGFRRQAPRELRRV
jgi:UDP-2,3-diacylglucosamine pyrophosphatase LpxH